MKKYSLDGGKVQFGSLEAKEAYIIRGVIMDIDFIIEMNKLKKNSLSNTELELLKLSKKELNKIAKCKENGQS